MSNIYTSNPSGGQAVCDRQGVEGGGGGGLTRGACHLYKRPGWKSCSETSIHKIRRGGRTKSYKVHPNGTARTI